MQEASVHRHRPNPLRETRAAVFEIPDELESFRDVVRRFAQDEVAPLVDEAERTASTPRVLVQRAGELGLLGIQFDPIDGGAGAGILGAAIAREELSYVCAGISSTLGHQDHVGTKYLVLHADDEQRERWLFPATQGKIVTSWAVTEPDAGSDVRSIRTTARPAGDGWIIRGAKTFITNGPIADAVQVVTRLEGSDLFGVFVVEREDEGFASRQLAKLGLRSSHVGELVFDDVEIKDDRKLSPPGGASIKDILDVLTEGRVLVAASALGIAQAAFDEALAYTQQREVFGHKVEEMSTKLAEADALLAACRLMTYRTAHMCDVSSRTPLRECSQAKLFVSESALHIVDQMMRVFGGTCFTQESTIERLYRDVRFAQIVEGTSEIQHRILARQLGL